MHVYYGVVLISQCLGVFFDSTNTAKEIYIMKQPNFFSLETYNILIHKILHIFELRRRCTELKTF